MGDVEKDLKKGVQAGWSRWARVSGVICDGRGAVIIKGKVDKRCRQEAELEEAEFKIV